MNDAMTSPTAIDALRAHTFHRGFSYGRAEYLMALLAEFDRIAAGGDYQAPAGGHTPEVPPLVASVESEAATVPPAGHFFIDDGTHGSTTCLRLALPESGDMLVVEKCEMPDETWAAVVAAVDGLTLQKLHPGVTFAASRATAPPSEPTP